MITSKHIITISLAIFSCMILTACRHQPAQNALPLQALPYPVKVQYDWMVFESDYHKNADHMQALATCQQEHLITVNADFAADIREKGAGQLQNGSVIGTSKVCKCGLGYHCFTFFDNAHRFGLTSRKTPRHLYTSVSASSLPMNAILYIPLLDGMVLPDSQQTHNGYVRVDSRNYFAHNQINLFVETQKTAEKLSFLLKDAVEVDICTGPECREKVLNYN